MNRRSFTAMLVVSVLIIVCWLAIRNTREPSFNGGTLSQWIGKYITEDRSGSAEARAETQQAVRTIGTNALPWLLLWIRQEDPEPQQAAWRLMQRLGISKLDLRSALGKRSLAWFGFRLLGPQASPAIPELCLLLENDAAAVDIGTNRITVAESAVFALGEIGPLAVPALSQALTNRNVQVRKHAAQRLGELGPEAHESVPALVVALSDTDASVRLFATRSLGQIHDAPEQVVPALAKALSAPEDLQRKDAASALAEFGAQARPAAPQLLQVLSNRWEEPSVQKAARAALTAISGGTKETLDANHAAEPNSR